MSTLNTSVNNGISTTPPPKPVKDPKRPAIIEPAKSKIVKTIIVIRRKSSNNYLIIESSQITPWNDLLQWKMFQTLFANVNGNDLKFGSLDNNILKLNCFQANKIDLNK